MENDSQHTCRTLCSPTILRCPKSAPARCQPSSGRPRGARCCWRSQLSRSAAPCPAGAGRQTWPCASLCVAWLTGGSVGSSSGSASAGVSQACTGCATTHPGAGAAAAWRRDQLLSTTLHNQTAGHAPMPDHTSSCKLVSTPGSTALEADLRQKGGSPCTIGLRPAQPASSSASGPQGARMKCAGRSSRSRRVATAAAAAATAASRRREVRGAAPPPPSTGWTPSRGALQCDRGGGAQLIRQLGCKQSALGLCL